MLLTRVIPGPVETTDVSSADGRAWLEEQYAPPSGPFVRLNMVTSLTGSATGADGTSETLANRVDRTILGIIRAACDVVVVGAQTVRAEGYVVPRRARLAIVTSSGRLDGHRLALDEETAARVVVLCPADRQVEVRERTRAWGVDVLAFPGRERPAPRAILAALAGRGWARVVCEGGPALATQFAAAGTIDEYCITVSPRLASADVPFLSFGQETPPPRLDPEGLLVDGSGFTFLRLRPHS